MDHYLHRFQGRVSNPEHLFLEPRSRRLRSGGQLALTLLALVIGCAGTVTVDGEGHSVSPDAGGVPGAGGTGGTIGRGGSGGTGTLDAGRDAADDATGDAAIDAPDTCDSKVVGAFTCCAGKPCRGNCIDNECVCAGIKGGCWAPLICCFGCTTVGPGVCDTPAGT